jgi:outer membrane protein assembly factor BamA
MRVSFTKIAGKPAADVKGIDVHVTILDGPRFKLGTVSARGASDSETASSDASRVLRIANLPRGDYVNGDDIEQAVSRIRDTLRSDGYLDATASSGRSINDAAQTADVWFEVNPGVLYKFGHLLVIGLGLDGEAAIRKMWSVKPGDPFPDGYPDYFVRSVKAEGLFDNLGAVTATPSINHQTHVVDVSLNFAGTPPARRF